jgi:F420-non-reducing hydrogenase small subunit
MRDSDLFGSLFKKGDVIFKQNTPGDTMFIIQSGAVEISCHRGGEKIIIALMQKGEFFGEMALIDNQPRSATATALSHTRLLPINRSLFFNRTKYDTSIIYQLIKSLCQRIERTSRLLRTLVMSDDSLRAAVTSHLQPLVSVSDITENGNACHVLPEEKGTPLVELLNPPIPDIFSDDSKRVVAHYRKGDTIFREGDHGDKMFVIVHGEVDIYSEAAEQKILLNRLEPGDFFGEMALVTGNSRMATAVAVEDTYLIEIDNEQLNASLSEKPEIALFIVQVLIARLRSNTIAIESPEQSMEIVRKIMLPVFEMKKKVRIALVSLSTCGGCTATIIQNKADLTALTETVDVVYCPMLMDADTLKEVDIAFVDGAVRTREDEQLLREVRNKSRFLTAWGTCAAFGGIPAMANQYELEELLEESYSQASDPFSYYLSTIETLNNNANEVLNGDLLRKTRKLDEIVRVDYFLPGCPPQLPLLTGLVEELKGKEHPMRIKPIVCSECPRKHQNIKPADMWTYPNDEIRSGVCLVSQGILCLGLITKGGCGAACLQGSMPCWGCRGPMQKAVGEMRNGLFYEDLMIDIIARRSRIEADKLRSVIRLLRQKGGSFLSFDTSFVRDASRLR